MTHDLIFGIGLGRVNNYFLPAILCGVTAPGAYFRRYSNFHGAQRHPVGP